MQKGYSIQMLSEWKREARYYEVLTPAPSSRICGRCLPIPFFHMLIAAFRSCSKSHRNSGPLHLSISASLSSTWGAMFKGLVAALLQYVRDLALTMWA